MPYLYVNTFGPLVSSRAGREASEKHGLPPFIDGSIRREPDLEHRWPSISCLCRAGKFAPRLRVGDHVLYLTAKARYGEPQAHRRFVAVLRVVELFESHEAAATWYREHGSRLPSNCMVAGNDPMPLEKSHQRMPPGGCGSSEKLRSRWDKAYRDRAKKHKEFVVCESVFLDLSWQAPLVDDADLEFAFGAVPGTQNPGRHSLEELRRLMQRLSLPIPLLVT